MDVKEFLLARIAKDEERAEGMLDCLDKDRKLRECAAKRAIIKLHGNDIYTTSPHGYWNQPFDEFIFSGGDEMVEARDGGRHVAWLTTEEYLDAIGAVLAPPAKELLALADIYSDHPDYQSEWAISKAEGVKA